MSKASEYAKVKKLAKEACVTPFESRKQNINKNGPSFHAGVNDQGEMHADGWLPQDEVQDFIKWLRETFED